jgi:S-adenosylmethionine:tRNA ribosyltransferase-isomerase
VSPATWPRDQPLDERLLWIDPSQGTFVDRHVRDLPAILRPGDLLVVNDAATFPASLRGTTTRGEAIELRLVQHLGGGEFDALAFGAGDWHTPTEHRAPPPNLEPGDSLRFDSLDGAVVSIDAVARRRVRVRFGAIGDAMWPALYRAARPIQYAYLERSLSLWHVQTAYATRPWAAEMPSAGRPLAWGLLLEARRRGVRLARLTHAAGISSSGDDALDASLPWPERYDIPPETVAAIEHAHAEGGRVIAVGTTVVRALEACALENGRVVSGERMATLRIGPGFVPRVVAGLMTGMHEPAASHHAIVRAFAPTALLTRANEHAERSGYLCHEFGDSTLVLRSR